MSDKKMQDRISELRKKIMTLEWDKKRNQINFSKENVLKEYKQELKKINLIE